MSVAPLYISQTGATGAYLATHSQFALHLFITTEVLYGISVSARPEMQYLQPQLVILTLYRDVHTGLYVYF